MPEITMDLKPEVLAAALDAEPGELFRVLSELAALSEDFPLPRFEETFCEGHTSDHASRRVLPFLRKLAAELEAFEGAL